MNNYEGLQPADVELTIASLDENELIQENIHDAYELNGQKLCVIFDQHIFEDSEKNRYGSELDRYRLFHLFHDEMDFNVQLYCNSTKQQINNAIKEVNLMCEERKIHFLIVIVLSHHFGEKRIYFNSSPSQEESVGINSFLTFDGQQMDNNIFMKSFCIKFMTGKPKLFIFQVCRGDNFLSICSDGSMMPRVQPAEAEESQSLDTDTLVAFATVPGCACLRVKEHGTIFISILTKVFRENCLKADVLSMLTIVNKLLTERVEIKTTKTESLKVMPSFQSRLTKKLFITNYFEPQESSYLDITHFLNKFNIKNDDCIFKNEEYPIKQKKSKKTKTEDATPMDKKINKICIIFTPNDSSDRMIKFKHLFDNLGFKLILSSDDDLDILMKEKYKDILENIKILIVIMIAEGDGEYIITRKGRILVSKLTTNFDNSNGKYKQLIGIPKVFIIQAVHGSKQGIENDSYGELPKGRLQNFVQNKSLPSNADVLIVYSSQKKFIQQFFKVFQCQSMVSDMFSMLTVVNRHFSEKWMEMPWFVSHLSRKIFLTSRHRTSPDDRTANKDKKLKIINSLKQSLPPKPRDTNGWGKGLCLIFNQRFHELDGNTKCYKLNDDCYRLKSILTKFDFEVKIYFDQTQESIANELSKESEHKDRKDTTCLLVIMLGHEGDKDHIWSFNKRFRKVDLFTPFQSNDCLLEKNVPKIFIFQSCGEKFFSERLLSEKCFQSNEVLDGGNLLLINSISNGYCSRYEEIAGSVFIQNMCNKLEETHNKERQQTDGHRWSNDVITRSQWKIQNMVAFFDELQEKKTSNGSFLFFFIFYFLAYFFIIIIKNYTLF